METREDELQALYEELECRYGPALAQSIIDEIRKADNPAYKPDYMPVKLMSEVMEDVGLDFAFYPMIRDSYYVLYRRAMAAYTEELPSRKKYRKPRSVPGEMARAA